MNQTALQEVTANYTQGALSVTAGVGDQKGTNGNTVGNRSIVAANYTLGSVKLSAGQTQQRWDISTGHLTSHRPCKAPKIVPLILQ